MDAAAAQLPPLSHLYRQHRMRALAVARRILGDGDEAEDVVQDVFLRLCQHPAKFLGRAAVTTWLHRIMVNSSINSMRSRRRRGRLESSAEGPTNPEEAAIREEFRRRFLAALDEVSDQHRDVLVLRELRGLSYPEISRVLGVPEGTVKSSLNRGRARLLAVMDRRG